MINITASDQTKKVNSISNVTVFNVKKRREELNPFTTNLEYGFRCTGS